MRRISVIPLLVLLGSSALAATTSTTPAAPPIELARVNGELVTDADLKQAFVGKHGGHTVFLGGEGETRRFLDIVVNEKLLIQEAYNLGLDADPVVKPRVDDFRGRRMADLVLKREIDAKATPAPEEIRAAWELAGELFMAREIVVDTRAEAESIRRALTGGGDLEALARACSTAPTRTRGGTMTPFTWGSLDPDVESAAFALQPGEISPVFETTAGWCVLVLTDRGEATRPPLDDRVSTRIAAKLTDRKKLALTSQLSERLWRTYDATMTIDELTPVALLRLLTSQPAEIVARWKGGQISVAEAFTPGELQMFVRLPPGRRLEKVTSTIRAAVNTALIQVEAAALKISEEPAVASAVDRFEAKLMESVLYSSHVLSAVQVVDDEVRASYEAQKAKLIKPERRRVAHIALATEAAAKALRARITRGEDFQELLKSHTLDKPSVKTEGDLGWIDKGKVSAMYDPLFALPLLGVGQPVQSPGAWHLIRVTAIEAEHPLSFDEAREKIKATLLEKKKHDAREIWIAKLREASEIEVIAEGIKAFVLANPYEDPNKQGDPK